MDKYPECKNAIKKDLEKIKNEIEKWKRGEGYLLGDLSLNKLNF